LRTHDTQEARAYRDGSNPDQRGEPPKERLAEFGVLLDKSMRELGLVLTEEQENDSVGCINIFAIGLHISFRWGGALRRQVCRE